MQGMSKLMTRRESNFKQGSGHALDPAGNPVSEWDYLNNFFKRYNKVLPHFRLSRISPACGQLVDRRLTAACLLSVSAVQNMLWCRVRQRLRCTRQGLKWMTDQGYSCRTQASAHL